MNMKTTVPIVLLILPLVAVRLAPPVRAEEEAGAKIVHDAEYYIIEAQNGKAWAVEDGKLDRKLAELRKEYGRPPNVVYYMWDDQPPMAFGDRIYQKIRGYDTPHLNRLAEEGMIFARMYTEPGCTPRTHSSSRWPTTAP